jgi:hypothetical protein
MSCGGQGVWQSPEERAVCGYDPDVAPRCLEVLTNRDENGDARVVPPMSRRSSTAKSVSCVVRALHGRGKPQPRHAHDQCALSPVKRHVELSRSRGIFAGWNGFPGCAEGSVGLLIPRGGVVAHRLRFGGRAASARDTGAHPP